MKLNHRARTIAQREQKLKERQPELGPRDANGAPGADTKTLRNGLLLVCAANVAANCKQP
ncbi:MAG TPA: hypothetical protein VML58_04670 [Burkholderiaceae bacterium]|nr:hypothetical protein [Burkholderiaceae bacterium]